MAAEVKSADLPIVHYMLDLWACKVSGKKYLSIHVFFVDQTFTLRHALLSVSAAYEANCCRWRQACWAVNASFGLNIVVSV